MVGKLTSDRHMSASRLPGLLGMSKYSNPNQELQFSINAIDGKARPDISNEAMHWGNTLEVVVLQEAAKRLNLKNLKTDFLVAYTHESIPLSCSLDGEGDGDNLEITSDPDNGIFVVGQDSIVLSGPGVLESKVTRLPPEDMVDLARGPIQLQGQLMITGHRWGCVCVLYQGTELRIFLFAPHFETHKRIVREVLTFQKKLDDYESTGSVEWYPPESSREMDRLYPYAVDKAEIELPPNAESLAELISYSKEQIRLAETDIEAAEFELKKMMGDAERARVGRFSIQWPMRQFKAQPEKLVAAKEAYAVRQNTLKLKEIK
jgi:predicted phage-related endonuclease